MPAFPKPRPKAEEKAEERRAAKRARVEFRLRILERDGYRCRDCGRPVLARHEDWWRVGEVHEIIPRSLGGSPLDSRNCLTLCAKCHPEHTAHRRRARVCDETPGADGAIRVEATD